MCVCRSKSLFVTVNFLGSFHVTIGVFIAGILHVFYVTSFFFLMHDESLTGEHFFVCYFHVCDCMNEKSMIGVGVMEKNDLLDESKMTAKRRKMKPSLHNCLVIIRALC
jgi:hypothetical protein